MNSGTKSKANIELTPKEAEAVLELWARNQAEGELRSRLNVQDLAEATGLSSDEVEQLVATVRATKAIPPVQAPTKKVKPVNGFLIAIAVFVWISILAGVAMFAYDEGISRGRRSTIALAPRTMGGFSMPAEALAEVPVPLDAAIAPTPLSSTTGALGLKLPPGMRAQAHGAIIVGSAQTYSIESIANALTLFVESQAPTPRGSPVEISADRITQFLDPKGERNNLVQFVRLSGADSKGNAFEAMLPFPVRRNAMLEAAAEAARAKIIRAIAAEAFR